MQDQSKDREERQPLPAREHAERRRDDHVRDVLGMRHLVTASTNDKAPEPASP
jgi:hypothetical protein